jgi:ABC-type methionine transport system ATPase subunit
MKDRVRLTFSKERIAEPVVCEIARSFDVTFSIRRADVRADSAWMDLELKGSDEEIERVIQYLLDKGVRVDPVEGDIVAG